jgi:hypothetical protein
VQGFWAVHFNTPLGNGSGVAYITEDRIFGGDGGYTYVGQYQVLAGNLDARLQVSPIPGAGAVQSVFGSIGRAFPLQLTGRPQEGDSVTCVGASPSFQGVSFQVTLRRVS